MYTIGLEGCINLGLADYPLGMLNVKNGISYLEDIVIVLNGFFTHGHLILTGVDSHSMVVTTGVVLGTYNGRAVIGSHSTQLNAWNDLAISLGPAKGLAGGSNRVGLSNPLEKLDVYGKVKCDNVVLPSYPSLNTKIANIDTNISTNTSNISRKNSGIYIPVISNSINCVVTITDTMYMIIDDVVNISVSGTLVVYGYNNHSSHFDLAIRLAQVI